MKYKRPYGLFNRHLETTIPYLRYKIRQVPYERNRLDLADGDFLDLDWVRRKNQRLVIISHGFEGNSRDYYVERSAKYLVKRGFDVLMWHFRSCSKELNYQPQIYSFNDTSDLAAVVDYAISEGEYQSIYLQGFSMGAATTLNYLRAKSVADQVKAAVVASVPMSIPETLTKIDRGVTAVIYGRSFYHKLKRKLIRKAEQFPQIWNRDAIDASGHVKDLIRIVLDVHELDDRYFDEISPLHKLSQIKTNVRVINSKNDPLLGPSSYPDSDNSFLDLCYPSQGGHLGFSLKGEDHSWIELQTEAFFNRIK